MWSGVGKSGSPAPKLITSSPAALSAAARAVMAIVADSERAASRCDTRVMRSAFGFVGDLGHGLGCLCGLVGHGLGGVAGPGSGRLSGSLGFVGDLACRLLGLVHNGLGFVGDLACRLLGLVHHGLGLFGGVGGGF